MDRKRCRGQQGAAQCLCLRLGTQFPKVKQMLIEAKDDLTAFAASPERHWKKIQSTNPLERINREIKRRTDVVQVFLSIPRPWNAWSAPCSTR
jgi:transposase-like protein